MIRFIVCLSFQPIPGTPREYSRTKRLCGRLICIDCAGYANESGFGRSRQKIGAKSDGASECLIASERSLAA
jgi:hypothetical protein